MFAGIALTQFWISPSIESILGWVGRTHAAFVKWYCNLDFAAKSRQKGCCGKQLELGMAGIHRSSTLDRAKLAEKQGVGAVSLFNIPTEDVHLLDLDRGKHLCQQVDQVTILKS